MNIQEIKCFQNFFFHEHIFVQREHYTYGKYIPLNYNISKTEAFLDIKEL